MYFKSVLLALVVMSFTTASDLSSIRSAYLKGSTDESSAESLMSLTNGKTDAIYKAYNGVAWGFKAKHSYNPVNKLDYVNKCIKLLNEAASAKSTDVEIRFLRFSVEENLPSIVSFTSHITDDKNYIISNLTSTHEFYSTIKGYMLKSKNVSAAERAKLK